MHIWQISRNCVMQGQLGEFNRYLETGGVLPSHTLYCFCYVPPCPSLNYMTSCFPVCNILWDGILCVDIYNFYWIIKEFIRGSKSCGSLFNTRVNYVITTEPAWEHWVKRADDCHNSFGEMSIDYNCVLLWVSWIEPQEAEELWFLSEPESVSL